ncbi:type II secretion system protein M [Vibrio sp.]|uniref:type II secretion system protein M n=1 Tax=Vibrio sp. TaxID=678 RepID=UPI003D118857
MNSLLTSLQSWWQGISTREQRMVIVASILLLVGGIYWGILAPLSQNAEAAQGRLVSEKQLLSWVSDKADDITRLRAAGGITVSSQPLNQILSSSANRFQISLTRVQPRGEMVQVWIEPLPFNRFIDWLAYLRDQQGVTIEFLDIAKADREGVVEVKRLQLSKG